jgi:hypothetical protein
MTKKLSIKLKNRERVIPIFPFDQILYTKVGTFASAANSAVRLARLLTIRKRRNEWKFRKSATLSFASWHTLVEEFEWWRCKRRAETVRVKIIVYHSIAASAPTRSSETDEYHPLSVGNCRIFVLARTLSGVFQAMPLLLTSQTDQWPIPSLKCDTQWRI